MNNLLNTFYRASYPDDPVELCRAVLDETIDETKWDILVYTIALNTEFIDGKKIELSLDKPVREKFRKIYNMAYLSLKVWSFFLKSIIEKNMELPNLYLSEDKLKYGENHLYKLMLGNNIRRFEHKWREIVWGLSQSKRQ